VILSDAKYNIVEQGVDKPSSGNYIVVGGRTLGMLYPIKLVRGFASMEFFTQQLRRKSSLFLFKRLYYLIELLDSCFSVEQGQSAAERC
jgi:hypothetical protein